MRKITNKLIACLLSISLFGGTMTMPAYAAFSLGTDDVYGQQIWMGWTYFESGTEGYAQAGGDGGRACGRYQFDYGYDLSGFVDYALSEAPGKFTSLEKYKGAGNNNEKLKSTAFHMAWKEAYNADPDTFSDLQDQYAYDVYFTPVMNKLRARGIDTDDPVVLGTIYSFSIRDGADNAAKTVASEYKEGDTIYQWLSKLYQAETRKHPSQASRWAQGQMTAALNGGVSMGTLGAVGTLFSSSNIAYTDEVKAWVEKYPALSKGFRDTGGWTEQNKEWAKSIRTAGDWAEMYGIRGGSLDFTAGVSGGTVDTEYQGMAAEEHKVPDNGSNNAVPYFAQNEWNTKPFGGGTISSSGCSITSFAMVISYLRGSKAGNPYDESNWIYPDAIADAIQAKYGNYNHFYVAPAGQNGSALFPALAEIYGIHCRKISGSSIKTAVSQKGHVVIGAMNGGTEWTSKGHFIVVTGVADNGYLRVNDPNRSHADKSYQNYTQEYITSTSHGLWEFY